MCKFTIIFNNGSFVVVDGSSAFDAYAQALDQVKTNNWKNENGEQLKIAIVICADVTNQMIVYGAGHV